MNLDEIGERLSKELGVSVTRQEAVGDPSLCVPATHWKQACLLCRDLEALDFRFLRSLCGVDRPEAGCLELVVHLWSYRHRHALVLRTQAPRDAADLASLSAVWPAANWHEREAAEMLGFHFLGHPDPRHLILPEGWEGHPLCKDYRQGQTALGIPTARPGYEPKGAAS